MNLDQTISDLSSLSIADRLEIVQRLWDSIPPETPAHLSKTQQTELGRRIAEHEADPESVLSRQELTRRLKSEP